MNFNDQTDFLLKKTYSDGTAEDAVVYKIRDIDETWRMGRRGFLSAAGIALSVLCGAQNGHTKTGGTKSGNTVDKDIAAHRGKVTFLEFGNNGSVLASKSHSDGIKLWEIPSGKQIKISGKFKHRESIALSPSREAFATKNFRKIKYFQSLKDSGRILKGFKGTIDAVAMRDEMIAGALSTGSAMVWSVKDGAVLKTLDTTKKPGRISKLAISPDERMLAGVGRDKVVFWNIEYGSILNEFEKKNPHEQIITLRFDPLGLFLITLSKKSAHYFVKLRDIATGKVLNRIDLPGKALPFLEFSSDGRLITGENKKPPALWHIPSCNFAGLWDEFNLTGPVALSPDKTRMAIATGNGNISVLNMPGRKKLLSLFDPNALRKGKKAGTYEYKDQWGHTISSTQPCGAPIPAGAICTCNCVPGRYRIRSSSGSICTCNQICTCVPIK